MTGLQGGHTLLEAVAQHVRELIISLSKAFISGIDNATAVRKAAGAMRAGVGKTVNSGTREQICQGPWRFLYFLRFVSFIPLFHRILNLSYQVLESVLVRVTICTTK